jgi:glycosyltransferase involved in cell wall biosynthesis
MTCKLSILIPSLHSRTYEFCKLIEYLNSIKTDEVQIVSYIDSGENSIGFKRNELLRFAQGEYIAFIDDDDIVESDYFKEILKGIKENADCCSLRGVITWDGVNPETFEHSIRYKAWATNMMPNEPIKYERYPNHINCIRTYIAKQFKFPEIYMGEDFDWSTQIFKSGLLKTEYYIDKVIYKYNYKTTK